MRRFVSARTLIVLLVGTGWATAASADPITVCWDGSGDFLTIQEGIDAAANGDEVVVCDGTYTGDGNKNLDFGGKLITVRSETGPDDCIIDCAGSGRGFCFDSGATTDAVIDGFAIINGNATLGGGVYCVNSSSPTIANCTISGHEGYVGAGVYCNDHCSPTLINCRISDNAVSGGGGGIYCREYCNPTIISSTIAENSADGYGGAVYCMANSHPTFANCTISGNAAQSCGGAIYCGHSDLTFTNCMILANAARSYWYGNIELANNSSVTIANCTIVRNTGWGGPSITIHATNSSVAITNSIIWDSFQAHFGLFGNSSLTVSYSDIQGGEDTVWCLDPNTCTLNWGPGNIDADPSFVQADAHLLVDSPCVDAGDPNSDYAGQADTDGEPRVANGRADIGADEFLDTDAEGLPDWWEQLYFGSPTAGDPEADDDGDGLVSLDEYTRHRDPLRSPTTYYVDTAGDDDWDGLAPAWDGQHGPKATIQAAINLADYYEQDVVLVADGTYTGHSTWGLNFRGRILTLRSTNGPDNCVIDCEHARRGFRFINGETTRSLVAGFSIVNGYAGHGGAVFCRDFSSPTIANCRIIGSQSTMFGGAVCSMYGCSPTITNCLIAGNRAPSPMFGIGGGVSCYESAATITDCTIAANVAGFRGGAIDLYGLSNPTITNSILWGNSAEQGPGVGTLAYGVYESPVGPCSPHLTASYSNIQDADPNQLAGWGPGNIGVDPLFAGAEVHDYRLSPDSPCIDAGDNDGVPADTLDLDGDGDTTEPIAIDLDGRLRFADRIGTPDSGNPGVPGPPIVDVGAYEYQCDGDLDGSGDVDTSDLAVLLWNYGITSAAQYEVGDLNGDGDVDLSDLAALLAVYGTTCP